MYYSYNIDSIINTGNHVYVNYSFSLGNNKEIKSISPIGEIVELKWLNEGEVFSRTLDYDRNPVTADEIELSIRNILDNITGLQWIGIV